MMSFFSNNSHPIWRLAGTIGRLPRYLSLARAVVAADDVPPARKALLGAALAYTVSPIDLVPGVIPVLGQLDDLAVLLLGLKQALGACPPETADRFLAGAGLTAAVLDDDVAAVHGAASWIIGQTAAAGMRALSSGLRALAGVTRRVNPPRSATGPPGPPGV
jgi:uncharacterized membrane protein YkvA (DUF1232 family)